MEEITIYKIREKIKENLRSTRDNYDSTNTEEQSNEEFMEYLLSLKNNDIFLKEAYKRILCRMPDEQGYEHYIKTLNEGVSKEAILYYIINSAEAKSKKIKIKFPYRLSFDIFIYLLKTTIKRIPVLSSMILWSYRLVKLPIRFHELSRRFRPALSEIEDLKTQVIALSNRSQSTKAELEKLSQRIEIVLSEIGGLRTHINSLLATPDLSDVWITEGYFGGSHMSKLLENSNLSPSRAEDEDDGDTFYLHFENVFRGSPETIKGRQSIYVPHVIEAHANSPGAFFLDVGCGRGEFLALLQHHGIPAKGVDINRVNINLVKEIGADVTLSDALEYLNILEDNSLTGLSMFQVIEHLNFEYLNNLLRTAFKKISRNGIIILESVNPYCPVALGSFYLDPTHIRPYPPDLMKFVLEWHRFRNIKIIYSSLIPKHLHFKESFMNYQTYAISGEKTNL